MIEAFIRKVRRSADLDEHDLQALERLEYRTVHVPADRFLLHEERPSTHLHVVADGWAARAKSVRDGRRQFLALLFAGEICDLDGFFLGQTNFDVVALSKCTFAGIDHAELRDLVAERPAIGQALGRIVCIENAIMNEWLTNNSRRAARERLAHLFCELALRLQTAGLADGDEFFLPLTQEDLADALGLTSVHVNRMFAILRQDGMLEAAGFRVRIRDWPALRRAAGFDGEYLKREGAA